jgi:hypothetical protein
MLTVWLIKINLKALGGRSRIIALIISLAAISTVLGPNIITVVRHLGTSGSDNDAYDRLCYLFSSMFLFWVIGGGLFQFNLSWQPDMGKVLMLPVKLTSAYVAKVLLGLLGPWLIVFLPPLVWVSYREGGRSIYVVPAIVSIGLFAILSNQVTSIVSFFKVKYTGRALYVLGLFLAFFAVNLVILAAIRAKSMGDTGLLDKLLGRLNLVGRISLWHWLPGTILARIQLAAHSQSLPGIALNAGILLLIIAAAALLEIWTIRISHQQRHPQAAPAGRRFVAALFQLAGNNPKRALMIREFTALTEMRTVRVLLLFLATYLPIFLVLIPPPNVFFVEAMITLPVMIFSAIKGNLLGPDYSSLKGLFSMPFGLPVVLRIKSRSVDLLVILIMLETVLAGIFARSLRLGLIDLLVLVTYCLALLGVWEVMGTYCSVKFPVAVTSQAAAQSASFNPSGFIMVFGAPLLLVAFALAQKAAGLIGGPILALLACSVLSFLILASARLVYWPWLAAHLLSRREALYQDLLSSSL